MRIRKRPNPKPCPFRPYIYQLKRGKIHISNCTTEETAKFLASLLLTTPSVSDTIQQQEQGA